MRRLKGSMRSIKKGLSYGLSAELSSELSAKGVAQRVAHLFFGTCAGTSGTKNLMDAFL